MRVGKIKIITMKRIIPHLPNITASASVLFASVVVFASASLLSGCSESELPGNGGDDTDNLTALTIEVTDGGYTPAAGEKPGTRAMEDGYKTTFTAGDQIGLYAVKSGDNNKIPTSCRNLCLTATDDGTGNLVWKTSAALEIWYEGNDAKYYAYYPYMDDMTGMITATGSNDVDAFFKPLVENWMPSTDQGTYAKYTVQDLMTGSGTVTATGSGANRTFTLSITLRHRMALAVIETPIVQYKLSTDENYAWRADAPALTFYGFTPCAMANGIHRYLVKPGTDTSYWGSYTGTDAMSPTKEFRFTPNIAAAGNYATYKVDGGTTTVAATHNLQLGDFYMKDGSLVGKDAELTAAQKAACLGIVCWAGNPANATDGDPLLGTAGHHPDCTHGLVVALQSAGPMSWSSEYESIAEWINKDGNPYKDKVNLPESEKICGYSNTLALMDFNAGKYNSAVVSSDGKRVLPIDAIQQYAVEHPAPANSSGWYFPALRELKYACWGQKDYNGVTGRDQLNTNLSKVGGTLFDDYYSSSTERERVTMWGVDFSDGAEFYGDKRPSVLVRPFLAF